MRTQGPPPPDRTSPTPAAPAPQEKADALAGPALGLEDLLAEARKANPEIRAAAARVVAARARVPQARSLPDPTGSVGYTNEGFDRLTLGRREGSNLGFSLFQSIPFPSKLVLSGDIASKEAEREQEILRATELEIVSRLRVAYYDLFFTQRAIEIVDRIKSLLEELTKSAEARYTVGLAAQQDVLRAQTEITILLERRTILVQQDESLKAVINSLLNRPRDAALGAPVEPARRKFEVPFDQVVEAGLRSSPDVRAAERGLDRAGLAVDLARKQYYPDFGIGTGYVNRSGMDGMWQVMFSVSIPLYFRTKQDYGVKEATSNRTSAEESLQAVRQSLFSGVRDLYARTQASQRLLDLIGTGALVQARLTLESSIASYTVGRVDFLTVLTNVLNVLNQELQYYQEVSNFEAALARLDRLVGVRVEGISP